MDNLWEIQGKAFSTMLTAHGITFSYDGRKSTLTDVSIHVRSGRTILLGPNGAGKTTLLNVLAGNVSARAGSVALSVGDGVPPVQPRDRARYARAVGWLPQRATPVRGLRVREQVAYSGWLKGMSRTTAWEAALPALDQVGMAAHAQDRANRLSGGQLRRVTLAQCLVHGSRVLLLDEPTAGLDPRERDRFAEILLGLPAEVAVVVSTHDVVDLVEVVGQVVVLNGGRVVFTGSPAEFLDHGDPSLPASRQAASAYSALVEERTHA